MENWKCYNEKKGTRLNMFNITRKPVKYPNKEGMKILHSLTTTLVKTYPKNCNNEQAKFKYLANLITEKQVTPKIFVELADVLKIEPKKLNKSIKDVIGAQILNQIREAEIKWD